MTGGNQQKTIVVVDDDEKVLTTISSLVQMETIHEIVTFNLPHQALNFLEKNKADLIISDYLMPDMDGITFLARVRDMQPEIPCIILTGYADKKNAIRAINEVGLFHYIEKPWNNDDLLIIIRNGLETQTLTESLRRALAEVEQLKNRLEAENIYLQEEIKSEHNFEEIVTRSPLVKKVLQKVKQVAATGATVLILGESGTGKELLARAVHNISIRRERPLVKVNCTALPANLIESELFGHEKGAFTGAIARKIGRFELADGGTIFLDEIGDLPLESQSKLLRILQEGEFERLGSSKTIKVDVRVISATNRDLDKLIKDGIFREDLYYRLNVFPIICPPLRERKEDIPLLVQHFIKIDCSRTGKTIASIPPKVMEILQSYHWPGNVRELKNIVERAMIISEGNQLQLGDWFPKSDPSSQKSLPMTLDEMEREHIIKVLEQTGWRVSGSMGAAQILGMKSPTLVSKMKKLGIKRKV